MSNYDVVDRDLNEYYRRTEEVERREAFIEYKIDELMESRGYAPFIADNFDQALDMIDLYDVAYMLSCQKFRSAGELLSTLVIDYWRGEAREEAERLAARVDEQEPGFSRGEVQGD